MENARKNADQLDKELRKHAHTGTGEDLVRQRQQEIQQQLAQLRSEAVQARRLAEQISSLSRDAAGQQWRSIMNSPTIDEGQTQGRNRRASDQTRSTGSQSRFNPLHPSMELPPEQLIRLLGLEDKITRKKQKAAPPSSPPEPESTEAHVTATPVAKPKRASTERTLPKLEVPTDHQMYRKRRRESMDSSPFVPKRSSMLPKAIGFGVVVGIAVSAYLFRGQPESETGQPLPVAATTAKPVKPLAPATPVAKPAATSQSAGKPLPVTPPVRTTAAPVQKPAESPVNRETAPLDDPRWHAVVEAQEQRLRDAAQQRLTDRIQTGESPAMAGSASAAPATGLAPAAARPVQSTPATSADSESVSETPWTETQVPQQDSPLSVEAEAPGTEGMTRPAAVEAEVTPPPTATQQPTQPSPTAELEEIPLTSPEAEMAEPAETAVPAEAPIAPDDMATEPQAYDSVNDESVENAYRVTGTSSGKDSPADGTEIAGPAETAPVDKVLTDESPAQDATDQTQGEVF